ncbi:MAG: hypothetical protein WCG14_01535 [Chlamydiia bacterium]
MQKKTEKTTVVLMTNFGVFLHSPFSASNIMKGNNRSLLLQFILSEIFYSKIAHQNKEPLSTLFQSTSSCFYPLDWSSQRGYLNKILEHCALLKEAFPDQQEAVSIFKHALTNTTTAISNQLDAPYENFDRQLALYIQQLYLTLEPVMYECTTDENFLFFLLKNQDKIHAITHSQYLLSFIQKQLKQDIDPLCQWLCDKFHARGFTCLIPEVKTLLLQLK